MFVRVCVCVCEREREREREREKRDKIERGRGGHTGLFKTILCNFKSSNGSNKIKY